MITLYSGSFTGGMNSCRIKTLLDCYSDMKNAPCLYKTGEGGVFCRYDDVILLSGGFDGAELFEFADILGVNRIETDKDSDFLPENGWSNEKFPVLSAGCCGGKSFYSADLRCCFEIISLSDENFANESKYLYWLSDMTRRVNCNRAKAYLLDDCACALVTAVDDESAYLSSVAVLPEKRGENLGSRLLALILDDEFLRGKRLFTAAQNDKLIYFYEKNNFEPDNKRLTVFKRRTK